jgi:hypothetical protein
VTGDHDKLGARLARSSGDFARSALGAVPEGEHSVFLLHAATALEHLAKAVLAARDPSLIAVASKDNFESLLHLVGQGQHAKPRSRVRTIGAREAMERAARFAPECAGLMDDLRLLIWVRDGIAHLADASAATVDEVLVPYLKASEELRQALGIDRSVYWGGFTDVVDSALREHIEQARLRVDSALAVARAEFARRFAEFDETTRKAVLNAIEAGYSPMKYEEQLLECPACETLALVSGTLDTDFDEDWDHHEGVLLGVHLAAVTFIPTGLSCHACHLELNGRDEMDAAGVAEPWDLEDVDEADFFDRLE